MLCSDSSCSSRAQRPRSRSVAAMLSRVRPSATDWAVATAVAALAAKERSTSSSSSLKPESRPSGSRATSTPSAWPRKSSGTSRAVTPASGCRGGPSGSGRGRGCGVASAPRGPGRGSSRRSGCGSWHAGGALAGDRGGGEVVALAQQDQQRARFDQGSAPLDDDLEDAVEVGLAADRAGDLGGRFEPVHGALHLFAAGLRRCGRGGRSRPRSPPTRPAPSPTARRPRRSRPLPFRSGRGCPRRGRGSSPARRGSWTSAGGRGEAVGAGMAVDVGEAQRARLLDQQAEHAAAARQVADRPGGRPRRCRG